MGYGRKECLALLDKQKPKKRENQKRMIAKNSRKKTVSLLTKSVNFFSRGHNINIQIHTESEGYIELKIESKPFDPFQQFSIVKNI